MGQELVEVTTAGVELLELLVELVTLDQSAQVGS